MKRCLRCAAGFEGPGWTCPECGHAPEMRDGIPCFAPGLAASEAGFPQAHFAGLAALEAGHFWFRVRNRIILDALAAALPGPGRFLEIGCGTGFVLEGIAAARPDLDVAGSEIAAGALGFAAGRVGRAALVQMDARAIPFAAEFDGIGLFDVLEHIPEDRAVLAEVHRALKPGGALIITVPQHPALWSRMDEISHHVRRYTWADLRAKLEAAGFAVLRRSAFMTALAPAMWLSRRFGAAGAETSDGMEEMRINPTLNAVLGTVLEAERRLIRAGLRLPFGGSLLAVARRGEEPAR